MRFDRALGNGGGSSSLGKEKVCGQVAASKDDLFARHVFLNTMRIAGKQSPSTIMVAVNGSVPNNASKQATAACSLAQGGSCPQDTLVLCGKATSNDAEMRAIFLAIDKATKKECDNVVLLSDSTKAIKLTLDPSLHSGQSYSLGICMALRKWLGASAVNNIHFVHVPARLQWDLHLRAHNAARSLRVNCGRNPCRHLAFF